MKTLVLHPVEAYEILTSSEQNPNSCSSRDEDQEEREIDLLDKKMQNL